MAVKMRLQIHANGRREVCLRDSWILTAIRVQQEGFKQKEMTQLVSLLRVRYRNALRSTGHASRRSKPRQWKIDRSITEAYV
jgi:ribonuclease PH